MDELSTRLLALGQMGAYLFGRDGHIWIEQDYNADGETLQTILCAGGIRLNNKIYGGVLQALDTIDEALRQCGEPALLQRYNAGVLFLGASSIGVGRITKVTKVNGGLE